MLTVERRLQRKSADLRFTLTFATSCKCNLKVFSFSGAELGPKIFFLLSQYPQYFIAPLFSCISTPPSLLESGSPGLASINIMWWKWCCVGSGNQLQETMELLFLPFREQSQASCWLMEGTLPAPLVIPADTQPPLQRQIHQAHEQLTSVWALGRPPCVRWSSEGSHRGQLCELTSVMRSCVSPRKTTLPRPHQTADPWNHDLKK